MEDVNRLISEIGVLESDLAKIEIAIKVAENKVQSTIGSSALSGITMLFGIFGFVIFSQLWYVWVFLFLVGTLAYLATKIKERRLKREVTDLQGKVPELREKLATKRAIVSAFPRLRQP